MSVLRLVAGEFDAVGKTVIVTTATAMDERELMTDRFIARESRHEASRTARQDRGALVNRAFRSFWPRSPR